MQLEYVKNAFRDIQDTFSETLGVTADSSSYTCTELEQPPHEEEMDREAGVYETRVGT